MGRERHAPDPTRRPAARAFAAELGENTRTVAPATRRVGRGRGHSPCWTVRLWAASPYCSARGKPEADRVGVRHRIPVRRRPGTDRRARKPRRLQLSREIQEPERRPDKPPHRHRLHELAPGLRSRRRDRPFPEHLITTSTRTSRSSALAAGRAPVRSPRVRRRVPCPPAPSIFGRRLARTVAPRLENQRGQAGDPEAHCSSPRTGHEFTLKAT